MSAEATVVHLFVSRACRRCLRAREPCAPCLKRVCDPLFVIGRSLGLCSAFLLAVSDTVPAMPNANLLCPIANAHTMPKAKWPI